MSEYSTGTAVIESTPTNTELLEQLLATEFGVPSTWVPSRQLAHIRQSLSAASDLREVSRLLEEVSRSLPLAERSAVAEVLRATASGHGLTLAVQQRLDAGLALAEAAAVRSEHLATVTLASRALDTSGWAHRQASRAGRSAIEARRGHSVMLLVVEESGAMHMDFAGHGGDSCEADLRDVATAFAGQGLSVEIRRAARHGSPEGGTLIWRAARQGAGDLLSGALAEAAPVASVSTRQQAPRLLVQEH